LGRLRRRAGPRRPARRPPSLAQVEQLAGPWSSAGQPHVDRRQCAARGFEAAWPARTEAIQLPDLAADASMVGGAGRRTEAGPPDGQSRRARAAPEYVRDQVAPDGGAAVPGAPGPYEARSHAMTSAPRRFSAPPLMIFFPPGFMSAVRKPGEAAFRPLLPTDLSQVAADRDRRCIRFHGRAGNFEDALRARLHGVGDVRRGMAR